MYKTHKTNYYALLKGPELRSDHGNFIKHLLVPLVQQSPALVCSNEPLIITISYQTVCIAYTSCSAKDGFPNTGHGLYVHGVER